MVTAREAVGSRSSGQAELFLTETRGHCRLLCCEHLHHARHGVIGHRPRAIRALCIALWFIIHHMCWLKVPGCTLNDTLHTAQTV